MRRANFVVLNITDSYVLLKDLGPWSSHPTVTNDADAVIGELIRFGVLSERQRVFYIDSLGGESELVWGKGAGGGRDRFLRFSPATRASMDLTGIVS